MTDYEDTDLNLKIADGVVLHHDLNSEPSRILLHIYDKDIEITEEIGLGMMNVLGEWLHL